MPSGRSQECNNNFIINSLRHASATAVLAIMLEPATLDPSQAGTYESNSIEISHGSARLKGQLLFLQRSSLQ